MDLISYLRFLRSTGAQYVPMDDPRIARYLEETSETPCPFCGGMCYPEQVEEGLCYVCPQCMARSPKASTAYYAKKLWNVQTVMLDELTAKQKNFLLNMKEITKLGPKSAVEISRVMGRPVSTINENLKALLRKGFVKRTLGGWIVLPLSPAIMRALTMDNDVEEAV